MLHIVLWWSTHLPNIMSLCEKIQSSGTDKLSDNRKQKNPMVVKIKGKFETFV
jgi:hypothetical protein